MVYSVARISGVDLQGVPVNREEYFMKKILFSTLMLLCYSVNTVYAGPSCVVERRNYFNTSLQVKRDLKEYRAVLRRYESLAREIDRNNNRAIQKINKVSGSLTSVMLQLGLEGVTALTNTLTCDDARFRTFCSQNKGRFLTLAKTYAGLLGRRKASIVELQSVDRTLGAKQRRAYGQSIQRWVELAKELNDQAKYEIDREYCLSPIVGPKPPAPTICNLPSGANTDSYVTSLVNAPAGKLENDPAYILANQNNGDNCPPVPFAPRRVKEEDGCYGLPSIGISFCSDSLSRDILGG